MRRGTGRAEAIASLGRKPPESRVRRGYLLQDCKTPSFENGTRGASEGRANGSDPARSRLQGAVDDRLFFAQVREDPALELAALTPSGRGRIVVVSSGGCTALSLLAAGATEVVGVDLNATQNHVVELKASALRALSYDVVVGFLGGAPMDAASRRKSYREAVRPLLSASAQSYWDGHLGLLARGVIRSGVTERFVDALWRIIRLTVHGRRRCDELLACRTLAEQRLYYDRTWNSRRWRAFFEIALNRFVFSKTYDPAFFAQIENPSFAKHFHRIWEIGLTEVPVSTNYFLAQMITGYYPTGAADRALPPYLTQSGARSIASRPSGALKLVDGGFGDYLRQCPAGSVDGFVLSNICEWLTPPQTDELFAEIVRTAAPGARLVFRNFVGWTEVPSRFTEVVVRRRALGDELMKAERSMCQRGIAVCDIEKPGSAS